MAQSGVSAAVTAPTRSPWAAAASPMTQSSDSAAAALEVSVVIPIYNEEDNVAELTARLIPVLEGLGKPYEVILVNDGSVDASAERLAEAAARYPTVRVINFRRNFGQTAAMMAGFDYSRGRIIIPMDGDQQNDPADIPLLLDKLAEGYDVVSGWRRDRKDNRLLRNFPSRIANGLISYVSGVRLNDYGCSLKAYRRDVLEEVRLYGEMHRFIPIYARWQGGRITEIPVRHHARVHGQSKYGLERVFKVVLDLMLVKFLTEYETKPIYVFGKAGLWAFLVSVGAGLWAVYLRLFEATHFSRTPLPLLSAISFMVAVMCILMGFLAEMQVRVFFQTRGGQHYSVRSTLNFPKTGS